MNYTIAEYDLAELGRSGMNSISCKVKGYWSNDSISLYVRRDLFGNSRNWTVQISHSSGGRDTKEVVSDTEAARYFGEALIAMCNLGDEILKHKDVLEANYQKQVAEYQEEAARERAAKQAAFDADTAIGAERAREIVEQMALTGNGVVTLLDRGRDCAPNSLRVETRIKTIFYFNGNRISKQGAIMIVAASSARSIPSVA